MAATSAALQSTYYRRQSLPPSSLSHRYHHFAPTTYFPMACSSYPENDERFRDRYSPSTYVRHNLPDTPKQGKNLDTGPPLKTTTSILYDSRNISHRRPHTLYEEKTVAPKADKNLLFDKYIEVKNKVAAHNNDNRSCSISKQRSNSYFSTSR